MPKPHSTATLKTLPPDQQKQIITWLKTGSQAAALQHIQQDFGLQSSPAALSRFYAWWHIANPLDQLHAFLREYRELQPDPALLRPSMDQLTDLALNQLPVTAYQQQDVRLLGQFIHLSNEVAKAKRQQAQYELDYRLTYYRFLQEVKDRQILDAGVAKEDQELDEWKRQCAQSDQRWDENHQPPPPPSTNPAASPEPKPSGPSSPNPSPPPQHQKPSRRSKPSKPAEPSSDSDPFSSALSDAIMAANQEPPITPAADPMTPPPATPQPEIPTSESPAPNSEIPHSESPAPNPEISKSELCTSNSEVPPSALHTPNSEASNSAAPTLREPNPETFLALLEEAGQYLERIEQGLRRRDYRPNYQHVSDQLLGCIGRMRALLRPLLPQRRNWPGPGPNPGDLDDIVLEAYKLAWRLDRGLHNRDTSPHLSVLLVPVVAELRGPLYQLIQQMESQ